MKNQKGIDQTTNQNRKVEGEGSYTAARDYKKDIDSFIADKRDDISNMAKDAEKSLDGAEGASLRNAEDVGKSKARH